MSSTRGPIGLSRLINGLDAIGAFRDPLPTDPVALLAEWIADAAAGGENEPTAMVLATATPLGVPSARVVLCKQVEATPPAAVFYTSYASRKGRELDANPRAAGVFHWPGLGRQARVEGVVVRTTPRESDEYFSSRPLLARLGAIASSQSEPLMSRGTLTARVVRAALNPDEATGRPATWGGYRLLLSRIELWSAAIGRLHDRVMWTMVPESGPPRWIATRLYP